MDSDTEVFDLRVRLERALADHADMYQQVEVAKRERMLGNAEIEGLKKYHFNELHDLHDQLLAQRSAVVQLNMRLQQATQEAHQAHALQDEIATMKQSHGASMKRLQAQVNDQERELRVLRAQREGLTAELHDVRANLATASKLAQQNNSPQGPQQPSQASVTAEKHAAELQELQTSHSVHLQHLQASHSSHLQELQAAHGARLQELQAGHEQRVRAIQRDAQKVQAEMQAARAVESRIMQEAHAADMMRLQELQDSLPQQLAQAQSKARQPHNLSPDEIDAVLAHRGQLAVSNEELQELKSLAANGADSAELAQETADLIALLHQARTSNATLRKERDRLRHKMDMFKRTLSSELVTMQLKGSNGHRPG